MQSAEREWVERENVAEKVVTHTQDEHRARYLWAADRVSGRILDVACGTGYGTHILTTAGQVTGVDRDSGSVAAAQERAPEANCILCEAPPLPFADAAFDSIVSFETIEHIAADAAFVADLRRALVPGGHLLISTPNRAVTSPNDAQPRNPFHVREYLLPDFIRLVRQAGFDDVEIFFQRQERRRLPEYAALAVLARLPRLSQPGRWWDRLAHGSGDVELWNPGVKHPLFWVLDCR